MRANDLVGDEEQQETNAINAKMRSTITTEAE